MKSWLLQGRVHKLVITCQTARPENMHISSIIWAEWVILENRHIYTAHISIPSELIRAMNLKVIRRSYVGGLEGRKGRGNI